MRRGGGDKRDESSEQENEGWEEKQLDGRQKILQGRILGEGEKRGRRRADEDEMLVANGIPDTG